MQRSRIFLLTALAVALLLSGWWVLRGGASEAVGDVRRVRDRGAPDQRPGDAQPSQHDAQRAARARPPSREREAEASFDRAKRDALRTEILQALADRPPQPSARPSDDEPPPEPGQLTDRIGGREALLQQLNHDFMPLADECIEQARARRPELAGMIAIGLETVADEELGGIVESVTTQPQNEVEDAELLECLSQTALSMILPPPPESGREQFMLTIPIEPQAE